jgi:O-antigen ligase
MWFKESFPSNRNGNFIKDFWRRTMLDRLEKYAQKLVLGVLFLWGSIALLSPRAVYIPLFVTGICGGIPLFRRIPHRFKNIPILRQPEWILLGLFGLWALASTQWSLHPALAFNEFFKIAPIFIAALSSVLYFQKLTREQIHQHFKIFLLGLVLGIGILILDHLGGNYLQTLLNKSSAKTYARFLTLLALGVWGGVSVLPPSTYRLLFALGLPLGGIALSCLYDFDAGPVAIGLGALVMLLSFVWPRLTSYLLRLGVVLAPLGLVVVCSTIITPEHVNKMAQANLDVSYQERIDMILWASQKIKENPLGYGLSQTRLLSHKSPVPGYAVATRQVVEVPTWEKGVWHLHNGLLQILLELGIIGFLLITGVIWVLLSRLNKLNLDRYRLGILHGYATAALFIFSVSYGVWQTWWLATLAMLTILYGFEASRHKRENQKSILT